MWRPAGGGGGCADLAADQEINCRVGGVEMKELQVMKRKAGGGGQDEGEEEEEEEVSRLRRRWVELEKGAPDISFAIEELSLVKKPDGTNRISTVAFLSVSGLLLQVIDKIGPTMAVLRRDVQSNIQRLQQCYVSNPAAYSDLVEILKKEADQGQARKGESCSRAIVWLTRSMDFSMAFVEGLENDPESTLEQLVEEAYEATLKPWHGWISSAAYKVAIKLVPDRETFVNLVLGHGDEDRSSLKGDVQSLVSLLRPVLSDLHTVLSSFRLDKMKCA